MKSLDEIEAILAEIERLDAATKGQFRQPQDREARYIVGRIMRKLKRMRANKGAPRIRAAIGGERPA
jgi:hypothetical protein